MKFIGRETELKKLCSAYRTDDQAAVLIYGRRRVGKSELIKHSLEKVSSPSIYYECKETSERNNIDSLSALISEQYDYPSLAFQSMEGVLEFLFKQSTKAGLILVLDEYPYLRSMVKGLDSILQTLLDRYEGRSHLKLILCGSFMETMKSMLLAHNPLYGRFSLAIHLKPMDYYESAKFYPSFSSEDKVRLYSALGGIPYYNRLVQPKASVKENLMELILAPGARLENEIALYLQAELSKIANANVVFETLAKGFSRFSDILSQSHISSSPTLSDILRKLIYMELVVKEAPINDENNKKRAGYYIDDNLSLFYYRYIFRYASQRQVMAPDQFYRRYVGPDFETAYVPKRFERICRQYLIRRNQAGLLEEPFERIGKYYYDLPKEHKNGEFDVVTQDAKGYVFYEAKFQKQLITQKMIDTEISQVQGTGMNCARYGFFVRAGAEGQSRNDVRIISLEDMYDVQ